MEKFIEWFKLNRVTIGYAIGGLNLLNGLFQLSNSTLYGIFWLVLGAVIIFDTKMFKENGNN